MLPITSAVQVASPRLPPPAFAPSAVGPGALTAARGSFRQRDEAEERQAFASGSPK